ncbi:uncharacterized protein M421DRAFT_418092 [Didymella exigua CBS 183.55]|uniref:Uncharacterized protein n=1 Tax=Didymella exigua CBS 183.55 TaxID=1150837 RepID=A0A6A5RVC2_9PLEO|nr:uncharacterized protein M421DRAFT_418092 [Didymella exigua CBS 183.55]KAF1931463.1 hypothetical protein M421DRAFT_418092 [Didymella exigua CBS 183.55]
MSKFLVLQSKCPSESYTEGDVYMPHPVHKILYSTNGVQRPDPIDHERPYSSLKGINSVHCPPPHLPDQ